MVAWSGDESLLRAEFERRRPKHERAARVFATAVQASLDTIKLEPVAVTARVKDFQSFREKIVRKGYANPFEDTTDLVGIRVIVLHERQVRRAVETIEIDFAHPLQSEQKGIEPGSGYRSHHLDLRIPNKWLPVPTFRGLGDITFEVQVRTALMHAWAEVEHAVYKGGPVPDDLRVGFDDLAKALRDSDDALVGLASKLPPR